MHIIRLREPWTSAATSPPADRIRRPSDWAQLSPQQTYQLTRHFHVPTGLESAETLGLAIVSTQVPLQLHLNGHCLGTVQPEACPASFEILELLEVRNRLELTLTLTETLAEAPFQIQLEIGESGDTD